MPSLTNKHVTLRYGTEQEYVDRITDKRHLPSGGEIFLMRKRAGDWEFRADEFMRWAVQSGRARQTELFEDATYRGYRMEYVF